MPVADWLCKVLPRERFKTLGLVERFMGPPAPNRDQCLFRIVDLDDVHHRHKTPQKKTLKLVSFFVYEQSGRQPIDAYITSLTGVQFTGHESDVLYAGLEYLRGDLDGLRVIIVPARGIRGAPRSVRKPGWKYVSLSCAPEVTLFDSFPQYEVLPAHRFRS